MRRTPRGHLEVDLDHVELEISPERELSEYSAHQATNDEDRAEQTHLVRPKAFTRSPVSTTLELGSRTGYQNSVQNPHKFSFSACLVRTWTTRK